MTDRVNLNVTREAHQGLLQVLLKRHGTLRGGVVHAAATEAVREWVKRQEEEAK